jgi:hypothetical protein
MPSREAVFLHRKACHLLKKLRILLVSTLIIKRRSAMLRAQITSFKPLRKENKIE